MMQNNYKIAITGGIGSGKSCVANFIKERGYEVISCDSVYGELIKDNDFLKMLSEKFGDILTDRGELDRKKLSSIVFSDSSKLKLLNEITHPVIMKEVINRVSASKVSFCEVPLLFENGYEKLFDDVIVVLREENDRISSIVQRDKISIEEALKRIKSQFYYHNYNFAKYYVIHNNGNLADLKKKTFEIVRKIEDKI